MTTEEAAEEACLIEGWADKRDDPDTELAFHNSFKKIDDLHCQTWKELAELNGTCYRIGWRYFRCDECDKEYVLPSRDCFSPSVETCAGCMEDMSPYDHKVDLLIPHNRHTCNLD